MKPDLKETYWGSIETVRAYPVAMKRMTMRACSQSSMEYHVNKHEIYWVLSGKLRVGLRVGRGRNTSVILEPGECLCLRPGEMHMRIALEDTVIMEACAFDMDDDTHIVFDGKTYKFEETDDATVS